MKTRLRNITTSLLAMCMIGLVSAKANSQQAYKNYTPLSWYANQGTSQPNYIRTVSIDVHNMSLEDAIQLIAMKGDVRLTYNKSLLPKNKQISLNMNKATVVDAINKALDNTGLLAYASPSGQIVFISTPEKKNDNLSSYVVQSGTITGTVTDSETGEALPGVNILLVELKTGSATDVNGKFTIENVPSGTYTLRASYIGYKTYETQINVTEGSIQKNIKLKPTSIESKALVVTAFGLTRQEKSVGYSVQKLGNSEINKVPTTSLATSLQGKASGVNITQTASGPGSSSRIVIRGSSSIGGNNQPLIVVDGVPIDNTNFDPASQWGGYDLGDGLNGLNPNNISDITILKGPNATALYGSQAANGAILITTKKGVERNGIGVEYTGNFQWDTPAIWPDFQNQFGHGDEGQVPTTLNGVLNANEGSWGPRMNGQKVLFFDGTTRAMNPQPNNVKDFYRNGSNITNTIALVGGNDKTTYRFAMSQQSANGITPATEFKTNNFDLRVNSQLSSKLNADMKISYIKTNGNNRPALSDNPGNAALAWSAMPRDAVTSNLRSLVDSTGVVSSDVFRINPYWGLLKNVEHDGKDRILGYVKLTYDITPWMNLMGRVGTDYYTLSTYTQEAYGTPYIPLGSLTRNNRQQRQNNYDLILTVNHKLTNDFSNNLNLGLHRESQHINGLHYNGSQFGLPGFYYIANTASQSQGRDVYRKEINSVFGSYQLSFRDYAFLELTGRNDWSSALPTQNNSYFYPSISASYVFSDALHLDSNFLSYGKIRASWAEVGNDTDPFQLQATYNLTGAQYNGVQLGQIATGTIPLANLKPERKKSWEFGANLSFLRNRINLDVTYYKSNTTNQILSTSISSTSGFGSALVNAGNISNKGIEATLRLTPLVNAGDFNWDLTFNFNRNINKVVSLYKGLDQYTIAPTRAYATIIAKPGEPYGVIWGKGFKRNANGQIVNDANGYPEASADNMNLGSFVPDWTGGIINNFNYKNLSLNAVIDISQGGSIYSLTQAQMYLLGTAKGSVAGRDAWYAGTGGYVGPGVTESGSKNTQATDPEKYWGSIYNNGIIEPFVYSASYLKLQEVSLSYRLPASIVRQLAFTSVNSITFSLVGRNLWFIENHLPGADPSAYHYNSGNGQGFEYGALPPTRTFGFNLDIKF